VFSGEIYYTDPLVQLTKLLVNLCIIYCVNNAVAVMYSRNILMAEKYVCFFPDNYYIYLKRYFEVFVTNDFFSIFWRTALKMLGLYHYALIIGHKSCSMWSILNKLTLQKELQTFVTNNVFLEKKESKNTTTKQKIQHKNPCRRREFNPGHLAPKADALPLHHRVNWDYRL